MAIPLSEIEAASERVRGHVHRTPVLTCESIDEMCGKQLFFKCEHLQKVGAFKIRGGVNAVRVMQEKGEAVADIVTHSSGNHAQAIALAGKLLGVKAHIVMPRTAPTVKRNAVRDTYGARVYTCEPTLKAREAACDRVMKETGAFFIHPYDNRNVQAGQGTVGLELMTQVQSLDAVVIAIGGGGMITGMASAIKALSPSTKVFGAEPQLADDAARSLASMSRQVNASPPQSIADGLLTNISDSTWAGIRELCDGVITVGEDEIAYSMRLVMERMKQVIEPSAAVPLAAVLSPQFAKYKNLKRVAVVLCGGNVDLGKLPHYCAMSDKHAAALQKSRL